MAQDALPTDTATFLFSDLEGSTDLLERLGPEAYASTLTRYRAVLEEEAVSEGGEVIDREGDGIFLAFPTASGAIRAAFRSQVRLLSAGEVETDLRARIGLHSGEALRDAQGFFSLEVHRAARVAEAAWGVQILLTGRTWELARDAVAGDLGVADLGEHRLKDLSRSVRLFQLTAPGLPEEFPPVQTLSPDRHNLPVQLTSFVGREEELAEVEKLLGEGRLVTLTGVGGSGKTRLALQVAARTLQEHPEGAWLVELAALSDPERVPHQVAGALGIREGEGAGGMLGGKGARPIRERLLEYLGDRELLLVLDNCEHLLEAVGWLVDLVLRSCPGIRVLATSREGLGIEGEIILQVPSLRLPGTESPEVDTDATRLFVERARAALPSFRLSPETRPLVARICRRLDGIPLAIELAAARVRVLGLDELADRLDDRFRILTGGSRTALPRQQTLEATIDWSYGLLTEDERTLFQRLSVFSGGFTLAAAEAVCSADPVEEAEVLELLTRLVDKSLVSFEPDRGRYRLLETLRAYAREKLTETDDAERTRRHHRDWFLALAEEAEGWLHGADQHVWLERLDVEHDNLRAALDWSLAVGDDEEAARFASLGWYWFKHGHLTEGRRFLERVLEETGTLSPGHRARVLVGAANLTWWQGHAAAAVPYLEESLELARGAGDRYTEAWSQMMLGVVSMDTGALEQAEELLGAALGAWRELEVITFERTQCLLHLGTLARFRGSVGDARAHYEEAYRLAGRTGDVWMRAWGAQFVGIAARYEGDLDAAHGFHREALEAFRELGDQRGEAHALGCLGIAARLQGDYERAVEFHRRELELERELGIATGETLMFLGELARLRGDHERAGRLLGQAIRDHWEQRSIRGIALTLDRLAGWEGEAGDPNRAARLLGAAEGVLAEHGLEIPSPERPSHEADREAVQEAIGPERFGALAAEGRAMGLEEAVSYAGAFSPGEFGDARNGDLGMRREEARKEE